MRLTHSLAALALFAAAACSSDSIAAPEDTRAAPSGPSSAALERLEGIVVVDLQASPAAINLRTWDGDVELEGAVAGLERYAGREVVVMGWHVSELRFHVAEFQAEDPLGWEREAL